MPLNLCAILTSVVLISRANAEVVKQGKEGKNKKQKADKNKVPQAGVMEGQTALQTWPAYKGIILSQNNILLRIWVMCFSQNMNNLKYIWQ